MCAFLLLLPSSGAVFALGARAANAAEPQVAAEMFRAGSTAFAAGQFRAAALNFEEAHRRAPHAASIFNAALAWDAAGERPRAADALYEALQRPELGAAQKKRAHERLAALAKNDLGTAKITGELNARVTVAQAVDRTVPIVVHLAAGDYRLRARFADGSEISHVLHIGAAGDVQDIKLVPPPPRKLPTPPVVATAAAKPTGPQAWERPTAWGLSGGAVVSAGLATALGVMTLSAVQHYRDSDLMDEALRDRAASLKLGTNIGWGVTALLAAGAGVLWYRVLAAR